MAFAAIVCLAAEVRAASKIKVAAIGDDAPGGGQFAGPALTGSPSAAGNGWVAFRTRVTNGGTSEQIIGTNLDPSSRTTFEVASLGKPAGQWKGKDLGSFKQFLGRPTVNGHGDVAFVALLGNSDALKADPGQPAPAGLFLCERNRPAACRLRPVIVSRENPVGLGVLDFTLPVNPLEDSTSFDLVERTPGVNDAGDVAFTVATIDSTEQRAAIFVAHPDGTVIAAVKKGDTFGTRRFDNFGPPTLNTSGTIAFRGALDDFSVGIYTVADGTTTRLVADLDPFPDPDDVTNFFQAIDGFGDLVALNDAGDVACSPLGLFDSRGVASTDGESGTIVVPHGGAAQLVAFPGLETLAYGRLIGGTLGPEGGSKIAPPGLDAGGQVYFFTDLTGGNGTAFFRAAPPAYVFTVPVVLFGGKNPDPFAGGFYGAAGSGPAVDASGNVTFYARLIGTDTTEALVFRPRPPAAPEEIQVGDPSPTGKGYFAGPAFASPLINDDDVVVFKAFLTAGTSALGIFRWQRAAGLAPVVRTGDAAPVTGKPRMLDLPGDPSLNGAGDVAYAALVDGLGRGVFATTANGSGRKIALPGDTVAPGPTGASFATVAANPVMMADGSVIFRGTYTYDDPVQGALRAEAIFRSDPSGKLAILARTGDASPAGPPFFRFRDPSSSGGQSVVFRAPIGRLEDVGDPSLLPVGLFLVRPSAAIALIAAQDQAVADGITVTTLSGRPAVDAANDVSFLARIRSGSGDQQALIRRMADGTVTTLAQVGRLGPAGGQYRSLSRPAMSSNGHVAFRAGFEQFTGAVTGFYIATETGVVPLLQVGEAGATNTGGTIGSLNPSVSLNASDHLAFVGGVADGKARNVLFVASPTSTTLQRFRIRLGSEPGRDTVRGRVLLEPGTLNDGVRPRKGDTIRIILSDREQTLLTATTSALTQRGRVTVPKGRVSGLRRLAVRADRQGVLHVTFASSQQDFTFGGLTTLHPPFTLRIDVGAHSGTATIDCDVTRTAVDCPGH